MREHTGLPIPESLLGSWFANLSMTEPQSEWYCFQAQPKREHIAAEILRQEIRCKVFCPRISYFKATKRGKIRWVEPLFPGYIFVYCMRELHQRQILATTGIARIVAFGDHVPVISDTIIASMEQELANAQADLDRDVIVENQEVIIADGPFRNMRAMVLGKIPARDRVKILIDFLGRKVTTEIPSQALMRVGAKGAPKGDDGQ